MENRHYNLEDSSYNTHTNDLSYTHRPNQMVQPQREYSQGGYQQSSHPNHQQNSGGQNLPQHQGRQYLPQHYGQSHSSSNGQLQMSGPPGAHPQGAYGYSSYYSGADDYPQHNPGYTSYPSGQVSSGGYPPSGRVNPVQPYRSTQTDLSPTQVNPQQIPTTTTGSQNLSAAMPTAPVTTNPGKKPDNITEFKEKADEMKGTYLAQLEKMIDDVKDFKKQKNIQTKNQFKFDEIQKKLTLLKTLITADFKPNSNFPPRKEILEAAEKQIKMWISEWEKFTNSTTGSIDGNNTTNSGISTEQKLTEGDVKEEQSYVQPPESFTDDMSYSSLNFTTNWDPILEDFYTIDQPSAMGNPPGMDGYSMPPTGPGRVYYEAPQDNPGMTDPSNIDISDHGYLPETILGKRQSTDDSYYESEQPPTKYSKPNKPM